MNDFTPNTRNTTTTEVDRRFETFPGNFKKIEDNSMKRSTEMERAKSEYDINQSQEMGISGLENNTFVAGMPQPNLQEIIESSGFEAMLNQFRNYKNNRGGN